ncbi:SDR family NAD(P)-dependent oxidoreductase [Rhizohabitans arisaemae]|uniref:SDR family NAD(P)-dependent oxidoreductase n=1 Tax=Rhizohabitans arisaemae TaxID=2720610 RepID=UPI0024B1BA2C|nr:SDR family oxidoreductase [Rhizohabitans arisaemae]
MNHRPDGKRVLVTGGTRGIGRALVTAFTQAGAKVVTCYHRDATAAEGLDPALVVRADVTDQADVRRLAEECGKHLGGLDVVVNNAGVDGGAPLGELPLAEWRRVVDVDLTACFLVLREVSPLLADGASVINIGASGALRGRPGAAHHGAAKAALIGLTASLAKEYGARGIRVNTVAPGVVPDGDGLPPQVRDGLIARTALRRLGTPEDVVGPVLFLAGDAARFITGTTLNVDGGI